METDNNRRDLPLADFKNSQQDSLCGYPFQYLMLSAFEDPKPCCRFKNPEDERGKIFFPFTEIQDQILGGKRVTGCERCYQEEELGVTTMRLRSLEEFKQPYTKNNKLQGVELGVGRICNLKCRSCNAVLSTKWEADTENIEYTYVPPRKEMDYSIINLDDWDEVKQIKVTGGEPFLHKKFLKFLQQIISRGYSRQIELEVYTNGFLKPSQEYMETLNQFDSLVISISVDAIGPKNNYIRNPSRWEDVEKTMSFWGKYFEEVEKGRMQLASTISHFNVLESVKILSWVLGEYPKIFPIFQMVQRPEHLNVSLLPYDLRQVITERLRKEMDEMGFEGRDKRYANKCMSKVFSYLQRKDRSTHPLEEFFKETKRLDQLRGESFEKEFPELHSFLKPYINY